MTAPHFETILNTDLLNQTLTLPNGTVLRNRLAKAAMSETLATCDLRPATCDKRPTPELVQLYRRWPMRAST